MRACILTLLAGVSAVAKPAVTRFDHEGLSFALPGTWKESRMDDGSYELRLGESEQIIVGFHDPIEGAPPQASLDKLAEIEQQAYQKQCRKGPHQGKIEPAAANGISWLRSFCWCDEPKGVATYLNGLIGGRVATLEHYRYDLASPTPAAERATATLLSSIKASECPVLAVLEKAGAGCLDASSLGEATVASCDKLLAKKGWELDTAAAAALGQQTGKKLICRHRKQK